MTAAIRSRRLPVPVVAVLALAAACAPPRDAAAPVPRPDLVHAMMTAEDARPADRAGLAPLLEGLEAAEPVLRRLAVRGLGRQERPDLVPDIRPLVEDPDPGVRAAAVSALARAVVDGDPAPVIAPVLMRMTRDPEPRVRAAAADVLGRLPYPDAGLAGDAAATLLRASRGTPRRHGGGPGAGEAAPEVLLGVAAGMESLLRLQRDRLQPPPELLERLRELATGDDPGAAGLPRVRRLALRALVDAGAAGAVLEDALEDDDAQVRRLAAVGLGSPGTTEDRLDLIDRALADPVPMVRVEAVAAAAALPPELACPRLRARAGDPDPHVLLRAVDGLAGCPEHADLLAGLAADGTATAAGSWHAPAHALVALARVAPERAGEAIRRAATGEAWPLRMYAARAAAVAGDEDVLRRLAGDAHPNVAEAALRGLSELRGHDADPLFLAALGSDDPQLLITAAGALAGSPRGAETVPELAAALRRITGQRRQTSRDARLALLRRIAELDDPGDADRLVPYLTDFDPRVAGAAAEAIEAWTGRSPEARPQPLPRESVPTPGQLAEMEATEVVLRMRGGGDIVLGLLPWEAPTNARRLVRLAGAGALDGLTFHRVVPNFVIQGGSPGANEYAGHGRYTRDELGRRSHLRGTVGVSTRGRDTGDGQFFVNLVDNPRLDHEYTIFARVRGGMETLDAVLEADVIEAVLLRPAGPRGDG